MSPDLKERTRFALKQGPSEFEFLRVDIVEYFEGRIIGDIEVAICRDCGEDVVWLTSSRGKNFTVNAAEVEEGDDRFVTGRHVFHLEVCEGRN